MKKPSLFLIFCLVFGVDCRLPDFIKKCQKNSKELNDCIKFNIEKTKQHLGSAISGLYIPKLEPYYVERLKGHKHDVHVLLEMTTIHYMNLFDIVEIDLNLPNNTFYIEVDYPVLNFSSTYTIVGEVLDVTFNSSGHINGHLNNYGVRVHLNGSKDTRQGHEHLILQDATYEAHVRGKGLVYLQGIVKDPLENNKINKFLNENFLDFYKYLNQPLLSGIGGLFYNVATRIFRNYCLAELFV